MTDIVERLRATRRAKIPARASLWEEAADEIERLREALKPFGELGSKIDSSFLDHWGQVEYRPSLHSITIGHLRRASAALEGKK